MGFAGRVVNIQMPNGVANTEPAINQKINFQSVCRQDFANIWMLAKISKNNIIGIISFGSKNSDNEVAVIAEKPKPL